MNPRLTAIARRRAVLVARAAAQRDEVGRLVDRWHAPLAFVDRGLALVRSIRAHPLALAVVAALLVRSPGGRLGLWTKRLWTGWRLYQSMR
ncbi:MAG: hypothetical protein A2150_05945 [Candidatus Muproteobacteria bacterium RBG_16_64_11]|uniref:YqjK-like protein n=1 Tax=Candidatus Muproteobacteria bacterium RBG_16_64_11 TaxID=1817758 RepID=A0A1F6TIC4_9PROT|nr:MAG: hypothetical protein A2150_05945 [Candidatus Muproteobacteria bacterium RBG_16_64_11]